MEKENSTRTNYIGWINWDTIIKWRGYEITLHHLSSKEKNKPYAYGSRAPIVKEMVKGDTLWLFSCAKYGRVYSSPTLVARFLVDFMVNLETENDEEILNKVPSYIKNFTNNNKEHFKYAIMAKRNKSRYFPINDAFDEIKKIVENKYNPRNEISRPNYKLLTQYFQSPKKLSDEPYDDLFNYENRINRQKTVFISYKRRSNSRVRKALVDSLINSKINCWLDISRMPQKLEVNVEAEQYLKNEINAAINKCYYFLALTNKAYFEKREDEISWTLFEYGIAKKLKDSGAIKFKKENIINLNKPEKINDLIGEIEEALKE